MTAKDTILKSGRSTSSERLNDRRWLQSRLAVFGERAVAEELEVARSTVQRARKRFGITPQDLGRRRGISISDAEDIVGTLDDTLFQIRDRAEHDALVEGRDPDRTDLAKYVFLLAREDDQEAITDLLVQIGATVARMHQRRVELAAVA